MTKWLLIILLLASQAFAQEATEKKVNLLQKSYQKRLELVKMQDQLLETLLKIPFEKRVYIYPALFEAKDVSKKIVTHPQIIVWKGKKPTQIAPQMQEYARENLEYMPAKFYPILDPDAWPKETSEDDWHNVGNLLGDDLVTPNELAGQVLPQ